MLAVVDSLAKAASGMPVNCRRFVDHFVASGQLIMPSGKNEPRVMRGQRTLFTQCEALMQTFSQIGLVVVVARCSRRCRFSSQSNKRLRVVPMCECVLCGMEWRMCNADSFVTGEIYVAGLTASFERTVVFVTSQTRCRIALRGIASLSVDKDYKIIGAYHCLEPLCRPR